MQINDCVDFEPCVLNYKTQNGIDIFMANLCTLALTVNCLFQILAATLHHSTAFHHVWIYSVFILPDMHAFTLLTLNYIHFKFPHSENTSAPFLFRILVVNSLLLKHHKNLLINQGSKKPQ